MSLSIDAWHGRYLTQASWTKPIRDYILRKINPQPGSRILDVGSGTGALMGDFETIHPGTLVGLDISLENVQFAKNLFPNAHFTGGDAHFLPFRDAVFDLCYCHYLFMWVENTGKIVKEMTRVTKKGGSICAFAEPDYGGRVDHPEDLSRLGVLQEESLYKQGADPRMGRKLSAVFSEAGLEDVTTGVIGAEWIAESSFIDVDSEWQMLYSDLEDTVPAVELERLREIDRIARVDRSRTLYVPTFYAIGKVK